MNIQMVSRHRFDGVATPVIRGRTGLVVLGSVCSLASGLRPSSDRSLLCARPVAIEHTGGHRHASSFCHAFAWHHHLLSDRSGALSPPDTGAGGTGGWRDRGFRKRADGGSPAISSECRSESNQRQSRQSWQNVPAAGGLRVGEPTRIGRLSWPALGRTSNVSERGVTAGETAPHSIGMATSGGAGKRLTAVEAQGRIGFRPQSDTRASSPFRWNFSSGDGLVIHQPGSMTRGTRAKVQTPSGRARVRAKCPAVARSFTGRVA